MRSAATLSQRSTKIDIFLTCRIACVTVFQNETNGSYGVSCWQRKFRMLWRRETGPKRHGRDKPGLSGLPTRFGAENDG